MLFWQSGPIDRVAFRPRRPDSIPVQPHSPLRLENCSPMIGTTAGHDQVLLRTMSIRAQRMSHALVLVLGIANATLSLNSSADLALQRSPSYPVDRMLRAKTRLFKLLNLSRFIHRRRGRWPLQNSWTRARSLAIRYAGHDVHTRLPMLQPRRLAVVTGLQGVPVLLLQARSCNPLLDPCPR